MAMLHLHQWFGIVGGGMGYMTGHHGYDGTPPAIWMIVMPLIALLQHSFWESQDICLTRT